jgi:hypothetical protein
LGTEEDTQAIWSSALFECKGILSVYFILFESEILDDEVK